MPASDGGPAFPQGMPVDLSYGDVKGMSLRDYFAAAALQKMMHPDLCTYHPSDRHVRACEAIAESCYEIADAMLKAREADAK